nr:hypothetical protein [Bradyrhizobium pachyrhizi]
MAIHLNQAEPEQSIVERRSYAGRRSIQGIADIAHCRQDGASPRCLLESRTCDEKRREASAIELVQARYSDEISPARDRLDLYTDAQSAEVVDTIQRTEPAFDGGFIPDLGAQQFQDRNLSKKSDLLFPRKPASAGAQKGLPCLKPRDAECDGLNGRRSLSHDFDQIGRENFENVAQSFALQRDGDTNQSYRCIPSIAEADAFR